VAEITSSFGNLLTLSFCDDARGNVQVISSLFLTEYFANDYVVWHTLFGKVEAYQKASIGRPKNSVKRLLTC
jgi:hypothetical protein